MMLDEDLNNILKEMADWRKAFVRKCNEVKELATVIEVLKNEQRIFKDNEKRISSQLNRKQENIIQLQEVLSKFTAEQERNIKICEENDKLKEEIGKNQKSHVTEKEKWSKEKSDLTEKFENDLKFTKETANQDVLLLKMNINKLSESNAKTVECLNQELNRKEHEYKQSISRTISNYEEELSKLNGDLAKAQTEIKLLRERCAANANIYKTMNTGKVNTGQSEQFGIVYNKARYEPVPIVTGQSQIYKEAAEMHVPLSSQHNNVCTEIQLNQSTRKTKLSVVKKRKLYSHTDEIV